LAAVVQRLYVEFVVAIKSIPAPVMTTTRARTANIVRSEFGNYASADPTM
jgi:hypothetical protein